MTLVKQVDDVSGEEWVPWEDQRDVDTTISFEDINLTEMACTMYSAAAAASLNVEGLGGASAQAGSSYMLLDFVASRAKEVDGVGKKYGFGARVVVSMKSASMDGNLNVTGIVANVHANAIQTNVAVRLIGLSSPKITIPTITKLDIDGYSQLIGVKSQIDTILSMRDKSLVTLNPTLLAKTQKVVTAPFTDDVMRSSYRLVAMTGIQDGRAQSDLVSYMLKGAMKIVNQDLFKSVVADTYQRAGIVSGVPTSSQKAAALEQTDGIYAARKVYS